MQNILDTYRGDNTVLSDYINTIKTTFDFNFDLNHAVKQRGYT